MPTPTAQQVAEQTRLSRRVALWLKRTLPKRFGFVLLLAEFDKENQPTGMISYISNTEMECVVAWLRQMADEIESEGKSARADLN